MKDADLWLKTALLPSADYIAELRRLMLYVMFLLEKFEQQQKNDNENQDLRSLQIVIDPLVINSVVN